MSSTVVQIGDRADNDKSWRRNPDPTSGAARQEAYVTTLRETRDPRAAVRAYCGGNRWAQENAKAVGNW